MSENRGIPPTREDYERNVILSTYFNINHFEESNIQNQLL